MSTLNDKMQERLNVWQQTKKIASAEKAKQLRQYAHKEKEMWDLEVENSKKRKK